MTAKKSDVWKSVGRRKSSIARVMISSGKGVITINRRNIEQMISNPNKRKRQTLFNY